jgi:hypothetical protein
MTLTCGLCHELPDAIVEAAVSIEYRRPPSTALMRSFLMEGYWQEHQN